MKRKRLEEEGYRRKDIISRLPDDVLYHILSCLPTEDAVRTTILSSRWKDLWTSIYNLYFDDGRMARTQFVNFVYWVLMHCQSENIHDFHVTSSYLQGEDLSHLRSWLCFAVSRNVRCLSLTVNKINSIGRKQPVTVRVPQGILTCKTLVELRLNNNFVLDIPDSGACFPSLKILHVSVHVSLEHLNGGDLLNKLFGSCPVLEDLSVDGRLGPLVRTQTLNILVPTLRRLRIFVLVKFRTISEHKFVIRTPNLEYLSITVDSLANFSLNEMPFLKEAFVSVGSDVMRKSYGITEDETAVRVMDLLGGIKHTKILSLPYCTMAVLGFAYDDNLPIFSNLIHLKLEIEFSFSWKLLMPFLDNSPNLEELILDMSKSAQIQRVFYIRMYDIIYEEFDWCEPESVPHCLLLHVKVIKITKMQREVQQQEMVKYLLENSKVLEKFSVEFSDSALMEDYQKEILMFPRGSKSCTIELL